MRVVIYTSWAIALLMVIILHGHLYNANLFLSIFEFIKSLYTETELSSFLCLELSDPIDKCSTNWFLSTTTTFRWLNTKET